MVTNPAATPAIQIRAVSHTFADGVQALADVSLSLPAGAFVALVGPSGVGKSTLLRIVGGLVTPTAGEAIVRDRLGQPSTRPSGIVFQRDNLMPWRTAYQNVRLPLELQGVAAAEAHERVEGLLELVGLRGFGDSYPAQLSGGMAQRVALARALVHEPDLLLLDEPFGALDALTRERMGQELLRVWRAFPVTVLLVTHSISEAVLLADEVIVLTGRPGTITERIPIGLARPRRLDQESDPAFHAGVSAVRAAIRRHQA